jgi:Mce-associated membrane protein
VALLAVCGAAYLKYRNATDAAAETARVESVAAAKESAIAILSYTPDTAEASLTAARDRLTGTFRDSYSALIQNVVIPGAKEQHISATATVPAAATVSASADHAVALLFVNQAITVGNGTPSQSASVVQVSLERVDSRWLITGFDPK